MTTTTVTTATTFQGKKLLTLAPLAAGVAAVVNTILFFVFKSMGLFPDTVLVQGQALTVVPIIISSILPTIIAALVFALIGRFSKKPWKVFSILSIVLLVLSFMNPFMGIPGVPMGMAIVLNLMHVVVVAAIFYFFKKAIN